MDSSQRRSHSLYRSQPLDAVDGMTMFCLVLCVVIFICVMTVWAMCSTRKKTTSNVARAGDSRRARRESEVWTRGFASGAGGFGAYSDHV